MKAFFAAVRPSTFVTVGVILVLVYWIVEAGSFAAQDRYLPRFAAITGLVLATGQLALDIRSAVRRYRTPGFVEKQSQVMDISADFDLPARDVGIRFGQFLAWFVGLLVGIWLVGFSTALLIFVFAYLRFVGKASWAVAIGAPLVIGIIDYLFFDGLLGIRWPTSVFQRVTGVSIDIIPVIRRTLFDIGF